MSKSIHKIIVRKDTLLLYEFKHAVDGTKTKFNETKECYRKLSQVWSNTSDNWPSKHEFKSDTNLVSFFLVTKQVLLDRAHPPTYQHKPFHIGWFLIWLRKDMNRQVRLYQMMLVAFQMVFFSGLKFGIKTGLTRVCH